AIGGPRSHLAPGLAKFMRGENRRRDIVEPVAINGSVSRARIEMRGINNADLAPIAQGRRSDIRPRLATIARELDHAGVRADPYLSGCNRRWRNGVNHAITSALSVFYSRRFFSGNRLYSSEIRTDSLPSHALIAAAQQILRSEIEDMRILGRKDQR